MELMEWFLRVVGTYGENKIEVSEDEINSIICGALDDGGITYWACLDNTTEHWKECEEGIFVSDWATKIILDGKPLVLIDKKDGNKQYELTLEKLLNALTMTSLEEKQDIDIYNFDAVNCNGIVQYALFGEIVYW